MDYKYLGESIRTERRNQGLTQEQLAEKADISSVFLSQIENGKKIPSLETVYNIALSLDLTIDSLFFENKKTPDETDVRISLLLKNRSEKEKQLIFDILKYALSRIDN